VPLLFVALFAVISTLQSQAVSRKRILVLCTGNSARSQMAEGILKSLDAQLEVFSAGTQPAARIHPNAVRASCRSWSCLTTTDGGSSGIMFERAIAFWQRS
jgi:arsenate reductase